MDPTLRARTVLLASFMSSMMFGLTSIEGGITTDMGITGIAALSLLAGGLFLERALLAAWRRQLDRVDALIAGALSGLPLSFFLAQNRAAEASGNVTLAQGGSRVVCTIGIIIVVVAVVGAWRRRNQRT